MTAGTLVLEGLACPTTPMNGHFFPSMSSCGHIISCTNGCLKYSVFKKTNKKNPQTNKQSNQKKKKEEGEYSNFFNLFWVIIVSTGFNMHHDSFRGCTKVLLELFLCWISIPIGISNKTCPENYAMDNHTKQCIICTCPCSSVHMSWWLLCVASLSYESP